MSTRREQILAAAGELAAEEGMTALSVRAVAARSGIGASTLRHYFPTQRDLYDAVLRGSFDAQLQDLQIADSSVPAAQRLTECVAQFLPPQDALAASVENWIGLYLSALGPDRSKQAENMLAVLSTRATERIDAWLAVLAAEGALRHSDRAQHTLVLNTAVDGLSMQFLGPGTTITVAQAREVLRQIVSALVVIPDADIPGERDRDSH